MNVMKKSQVNAWDFFIFRDIAIEVSNLYKRND